MDRFRANHSGEELDKLAHYRAGREADGSSTIEEQLVGLIEQYDPETRLAVCANVINRVEEIARRTRDQIGDVSSNSPVQRNIGGVAITESRPAIASPRAEE